MDCEPTFSDEGLHAAIIASASRTSNRDYGVRTFRSHRDVETTTTIVEPCNASTALDIRRHQSGSGTDNAAASHRQNTNARFTHRDARNAGSGKSSEIGDTQALASAPQRDRGITVSPGCQNTVARIDNDKCFGSAANNLHRINGGNTVGAGRQRLPHLDARGRTQKKRWRVATGAQCFVGGQCPTILQRKRRRGTRRRHRVRGKRSSCAGRDVDRALGNRLYFGVDNSQHIGERCQP